MAEIDKPLPNTNQTQIPNEEIIEVEKTKSAEVIDTPTGPVEVAMDEEGGAEVSFDPNAAIDPIQDHFANLAESLGDEILEPLGAKMVEQYNEYKESRGDWEDTYRNGLELLDLNMKEEQNHLEAFWCQSPSSCGSSYAISSASL